MFDSCYLMLYYFSWKNKKNKCVKVNKTIPITNSFDTDNSVKLFCVENDDSSKNSFDSDVTEKFFYYHDVYCK